MQSPGTGRTPQLRYHGYGGKASVQCPSPFRAPNLRAGSKFPHYPLFRVLPVEKLKRWFVYSASGVVCRVCGCGRKGVAGEERNRRQEGEWRRQ
ncbi:hypothetical protein GEV33_005036 [Tenebrio molitor]|uniref:Uncharacterized protein n=1 Tax=Tenebrio molitor TaxID=7067 RepID=A0A8J6HNA4_TENMO|nr:hypothetical protein GEV33_005036 [Tenebrio molitor]